MERNDFNPNRPPNQFEAKLGLTGPAHSAEWHKRNAERRLKKTLAETDDLVTPEFEEMTPFEKNVIRKAAEEFIRRQTNSLYLYEPLPYQDEFHRCKAIERLALGGNRSGKTTTAAVEVAMAVTGKHPYLPYPKENGVFVCVAKDGTQVSEVMYSKLFKPGLFRIFFDRVKRRFRMWRPWADSMEDFKRSRPSEPLIPADMIKTIAWEERARGIPKKVTLTNGWEILFFSSNGRPIHGVAVDGVWFDEEIQNMMWYPEAAARLVDRGGRFFWSATPQKGTDQLFSLYERATECEGGENPPIVSFTFLMENNPFLSEQDRKNLIEKFANDPDEYNVRVKGKFLVASHLVYPTFSRSMTCCQPFDIPPGWTRYVSIDPGFSNVVGLFFAVPPDNSPKAGHVYLYDEVYGRQCDVNQFAEMMAPKINPHVFQCFIIDRHGSRRTEVGGKTICQQYAEAFKKLNLQSIETQSNFLQIGGVSNAVFGTKTLTDEIHQVRSWMYEQDDGRHYLQVFLGPCENFIGEMTRYRHKLVDGKATDTPDERKWSHGPAALRYAVLHGLAWKKPRARRKNGNTRADYVRAKRQRKRQLHDGNYVLMGSS